jgi:hypothetical protein
VPVDDVVVVAAKNAWPEYLEHAAYVTHSHRPRRPTAGRLGFYRSGAIQPLVPRIEDWLPSVLFTAGEAEGWRARGHDRMAVLIERLLRAGPRTDGESFGVMLLSAPEDQATVRLAAPIVNDSRSPRGTPVPWTRWQRYTSLEALTSGATKVSEL